MKDPAERQKGEMPEWSIGAVSKTVERFAFQGFESLSLRKNRYNNELYRFFYFGSDSFFYTSKVIIARSILGSIGEKCVPSTSSNVTAAWVFAFKISAAVRVLSSTVDILFSLAFFSFSPNSMQIFFN